ncbi:MAG: hypothetical protein CBB97_10480, partial [Candidatus Endolissoclinum sp. TMED37]
GLLYEGRTLQGARPKLADFCSATMAEFYSAVDTCAVALSKPLVVSAIRVGSHRFANNGQYSPSLMMRKTL